MAGHVTYVLYIVIDVFLFFGSIKNSLSTVYVSLLLVLFTCTTCDANVKVYLNKCRPIHLGYKEKSGARTLQCKRASHSQPP